MMRIGIFVAVAGRQGSGPEIYEISLIRKLAELDNVNEYHLFCFNQKAKEALNIYKKNFIFHVLWPDIRLISLPISLQFSMLKSKIDFFHATFVPPPFSLKPYIMTMHGSDMFIHPEFFTPNVLQRLVTLLKRGFKQSALIVCVSQHVAGILKERFPIPEERLKVVYHGVSERFKPWEKQKAASHVQKTYGLTKPYILYVGKLVAGKNIDRLFEAYQLFLKNTRADVDLVLAGKTYPGLVEANDYIKDPAVLQRIKRLGQVAQEELPALYSGAEMFVFPTLWEGFGLPVIEAMACGVPVITSDVACLPEITAKAALLIQPESVTSIEQAMRKLYQRPECREDFIKRGLHRAAQFTWENTARTMIEIYNQLGQKLKKI
jgi:glycosyltransferase involved in cell wall biosynthesis